MPRRKHDHPFVARAGKRFHQLRKEKRYTLDQVSEGAGLRGKGYVSQFEHGQALPAANTLDRLAYSLGVDVIDLVNFPERGLRNQLTEMTRDLDEASLSLLLRQATAMQQRPQREWDDFDFDL